MQLASERPEFAALHDYLTTRSALPPVEFARLSPGTSGQFETNSFFGRELPPTGKVQLNGEFLDRAYGPTSSIPTLIHELTHAAGREMSDQYNQRDVLDQEAKDAFKQAYDKLVYYRNAREIDARFPQSVLANKLAPAWGKANEAYRASIGELPSFAMGNVSGNASQPAPAHVDPTLATEYRILLDAALRDARANPYKKTR